MEEQEITRETLEELWFQKLMEDYARERGELLIQENERLKADPNAAVPEDVHQRNLRLIEELMGK